jgi:hypothetical protein
LSSFLCVDCGACRLGTLAVTLLARPAPGAGLSVLGGAGADDDADEGEAAEREAMARAAADATAAREARGQLRQLRDTLARTLSADTVVTAASSTAFLASDGGRGPTRRLPRTLLALERLYNDDVQRAASALAVAARSLAIGRREVCRQAAQPAVFRQTHHLSSRARPGAAVGVRPVSAARSDRREHRQRT